MVDFTNTNTLVGIAVIILNLIPILTKKYKYLLLTAVLSVLLMYLTSLI